MGFLTSIGKMFGASEPQQRSKSGATTHSSASPQGGVGVVDQATARREQLQREHAGAAPQRRARQTRAKDASVVVAPDAAPKNKQELFEELQRNYQGVVDLVKKVDAHLDRNESRAEEMVAIARRIDETLPALSRFPDEVRTQLDDLRTEVVGAITSVTAKGDARAEETNSTLLAISERIDATGHAHGQLVTTMAGFRETLGELATSSERTSDVLQSIDVRRQEREDELTRMLVASRRWSVVTLAVTLVGVSAAVAVAIIALALNA